jgi:hypothetical protein
VVAVNQETIMHFSMELRILMITYKLSLSYERESDRRIEFDI